MESAQLIGIHCLVKPAKPKSKHFSQHDGTELRKPSNINTHNIWNGKDTCMSGLSTNVQETPMDTALVSEPAHGHTPLQALNARLISQHFSKHFEGAGCAP
jgi:hypothetical protein